jgi:hypothetical protein
MAAAASTFDPVADFADAIPGTEALDLLAGMQHAQFTRLWLRNQVLNQNKPPTIPVVGVLASLNLHATVEQDLNDATFRALNKLMIQGYLSDHPLEDFLSDLVSLRNLYTSNTAYLALIVNISNNQSVITHENVQTHVNSIESRTNDPRHFVRRDEGQQEAYEGDFMSTVYDHIRSSLTMAFPWMEDPTRTVSMSLMAWLSRFDIQFLIPDLRSEREQSEDQYNQLTDTYGVINNVRIVGSGFHSWQDASALAKAWIDWWDTYAFDAAYDMIEINRPLTASLLACIQRLPHAGKAGFNDTYLESVKNGSCAAASSR